MSSNDGHAAPHGGAGCFDASDSRRYEPVFAQMAARRQEAPAMTEEAVFIAQAQRLATLAR